MLKSSSVLIGFVIAAVVSAGLLLGFGLLANDPEASTPLEPAASNTESPKPNVGKAFVAGNDQPTSDSEVSRNILGDEQIPAAKKTDAGKSPSIAAQGVAPIRTTAVESQLNLLELSDLTAEVAAQIVLSQSLKPEFQSSTDELQLDTTLVSAGATPSMVRQMRLALIESHPHGSRRFEQILARTDSPQWQAVANSFGNYVHLPKVTSLSPDAAQSLARFAGTITLSGIETIDAPVAQALASGDATLLLYGLKSLDADVAKELAAAQGIGLRGLKELSPEAAGALAQGKSESINLSGLDELPPAVAESLASFTGILDLSGVSRLSVESAQQLGRSSSKALILAGLREMSADVAQQLAGHKGYLWLGGLSSMSPEVAGALSAHDGNLVLTDVTVRVPTLVVAPRALDSVVAGSVLQLPVYKALVADGKTTFRVTDDRPPSTQQSQGAPRPPKEPAKAAKSVTDIMDSPDEYVNGTYKVNVWVDTFWMHREKKTLPNDEVIFDGYCLQIKDGLRDARSAEGLGEIALSLSRVSPVIGSKELARGLQDALKRGRDYRFLATVTLSQKDVLTRNILVPNSPPREGRYLLMDITQLEVLRPDGTAIVVNGQSTPEDFVGLRTALESFPSIAATSAAQPAESPEKHAAREESPRPAAPLRPQAQMARDSEAAVARFEAESQAACFEMLRACRAASGTPRDTVTDFTGDSATEMHKRLDEASKGSGISAGCAKAMLTYLGMYGMLLAESVARFADQDVPQGGLVPMIDSWMADGMKALLKESDNADKYWTLVASNYALIHLYAEANTFNADFEKQLIAESKHPAIGQVIEELRKLRRNMRSLLLKRYADSVATGVQKYGPPMFSEK